MKGWLRLELDLWEGRSQTKIPFEGGRGVQGIERRLVDGLELEELRKMQEGETWLSLLGRWR